MPKLLLSQHRNCCKIKLTIILQLLFDKYHISVIVFNLYIRMILFLKRPKTKQKVFNQNCGFKTRPCIGTAFKNDYVDINACCLKENFLSLHSS